MDPASVGAWFTGIGGVIVAITALVKVVTTRPRLPVAEELLEQIDELRDDVLALARWAHRQITRAAAQGVELDPLPEVLRGSGEREGERLHDEDRHGWRSSVRAQTGPQPVVDTNRMPPATGPDTRPERRVRRPAPPMRE